MGWARYTLNKRILFQDDKRANNFLLKHVYLFPEKKTFVFNMVKLHYLLNFKYHKMQLSVVLPSKIYIQCSVEYSA